MERASARRVLGLSSDPDTIKDGSLDAFVEGLIEQLRTHTTFRLSIRRDGLTFRTGKGTLHVTATIDWVGNQLTIGPKYNKRRAAAWTAELMQRRKRIDAAFGGNLNWVECEDSLYVFTSMKRVPFKSISNWPATYAEIAEIFQQFKMHFEPPQRRY